jgi:hypothetical protein
LYQLEALEMAFQNCVLKKAPDNLCGHGVGGKSGKSGKNGQNWQTLNGS